MYRSYVIFHFINDFIIVHLLIIYNANTCMFTALYEFKQNEGKQFAEHSICNDKDVSIWSGTEIKP